MRMAVISSTIFGALSFTAQAGLVPVLTSSNTNLLPDLGQGYLFSNVVGSVTLTVVNGDTIGSTFLPLPLVNGSVDALTAAIGLADSLTFSGDATVTGYIGPTNPLNNVNLNGANDTVSFQGSINANNLKFNADAIAKVSDNMSINAKVDNTSGVVNRGEISFQGSGSISGDIGSSKALKLITANAQSGVSETLTLSGSSINVATINLDDDGSGIAVNGTTLKLNNAAMVLTGKITNSTHNENTLDIENASKITGQLGTNTQAFNLIKVAQNTDLQIDGNIYATTTQFQGNHNLTLTEGSVLTGQVTTTNNNTGKLNFSGATQVTGNIGGANSLAELNLNTAGGVAKSIELNGAVIKAAAINLDDDGSGLVANGTILKLNNAAMVLTGSLTNNTHNENTLNIENAAQIVGQLGTNAKAFNLIKVAQNNDIEITGNVYATTTQFQSNKQLILNDGYTIVGQVTTNTNNTGKLNLSGGGQVTGNIGSTNSLSVLDLNTAGGVAKAIELNGAIIKAGAINLDDDGSGIAANGTTLKLNNAAMVLTGNLSNNTHNENTLNIENATQIVGQIGTNAKAFNLIQVAQNTDLKINGNIYANTTEFQGNHALIFNNNQTITGQVDAKANNIGKLDFTGSGVITGNIGANHALSEIVFNRGGSAGQSLELNGAVIKANSIQVGVQGGLPTTLKLNSSGAMDLVGNIKTLNHKVDLLDISNHGLTTITGNIGDANHFFDTLKVGQFGDVEIHGHVYTDTTWIMGNSKIIISPNMNVYGQIDAGGNKWGKLEIDGSSILVGDIGKTNQVGAIEINGAGSTIHFQGDVYADIVNINAPSNVVIANNKNFMGPVNATAFFMGNLKFAGNSVVNFCIGDDPLDTVEFNGGVGTNVTLNNDILAKNVFVNGGGQLTVISAVDIDANLSITNNSILGITTAANPVTVTGDFLLDAGTTYQINMNNILGAGLVDVKQTATISPNAQIEIINAPLTVPSGQTILTILTDGAAGVNLNALPVVSSNLFTNVSSQVQGNALQLVIGANANASVYNFCPTVPIASTLDELINLPVSGTLKSIVDELSDFSNEGSLCQNIRLLQPVMDGAVINESYENQRLVFSILDERAAKIHYCRKNPTSIACRKVIEGGNYGDLLSWYDPNDYYTGTWFKVFGLSSNQSERRGMNGYKDYQSGYAAGIDAERDNFIAGMGLSWTEMHIHHQDDMTNTTVSALQEAFYGNIMFDNPFYINWALGISYNKYFMDKQIPYGGLGLHVEDCYRAWQTGWQAELGYSIQNDLIYTIPFIQLFYSHLNFHDYQQKGLDTANQYVRIEDTSQFIGGVGVKYVFNYTYDRFHYQPELHFSTLYDFIGEKPQTASQFIGGGSTYETIGVKPVKSGVNYGISLSVFAENGIALVAKVDRNSKKGYYANTGYINLRYLW